MYTKCEHCGEFAVDDSENIEVCKSCGIVVTETTFSSAECVPASRSFTPFNKSEARLAGRKKKPITLLHGQKVLDHLCHINYISMKWKTEITELLKLVVSVKRFNRKEDAGTAAACCLFLFLRKENQLIPINTLCKQVPCTKGKFSFFLKFLKSCLSSNEKFKQYSSILDISTNSQKRNEEDAPAIVQPLIYEILENAETEEKTQLMEKTASLVKLAYSCWLFTGRSPKSVVVAAAFLCWKSMHRWRNRTPYTKFCAEFEIREPTGKFRIRELTALLLKLGKMIPARTENYVNKDNVLFHLNTILKYSETLRNDLFPNSYNCQEVDIVEFSNFRDPPQRSFRRVEASDAVHYDSDMNASDIEISNSEIESYLVSDKKKIIDFCEMKQLELSKNF